MAYTAVDFVNIKSDYEALKKQFDILSHCMEETSAIMSRIEYFAGHFNNSSFENLDSSDDLPL